MNNVTIVLIKPQIPGNIGAIARVMGNFAFQNLVIIEPKCDPFDKEALDRAKHAKPILESAKVKDISCLKEFDLVIGTTAKLGNKYNIKRLFVTPKQLKEKLPKKGKVAILFGNEGEGLSNEEVSLCDFVVYIPTNPEYPTLNLSHSVSVILYELFDAKPIHELMDKKQKDFINKLISENLPLLGFTDKMKTENQKRTWNQILSKSSMSKREAFIIMGYFKKSLNALSKGSKFKQK
ncbi:MAG: RNA methyltransferase [Candidatus Woesearchaeota archaeon]|jgi:TrmH family RNA methyltransferase